MVSCGTRDEILKRILYIHHGGSLGGAPLSLLYLLQQLDRTRYEPVVLCLAEGPATDRFRSEGIETHVSTDIVDFSHTELVWYGNKLLWQLLGKALRFGPSVMESGRILRRLKPDLVHLNSSTLASSACAAHRAGVPIIWHVREPLAHGYVGLRRAWLRREINRYADRIIAISTHDAAQLIPSEKMQVIHNFVDFSTFDRSILSVPARADLNLSLAQHVVTMLGGCSESKGTLPFLEALYLVRQQVPNVHFLVVGRKPLMGSSSRGSSWMRWLLGVDSYDRSVTKVASQAISSGNVHFLGVRSDVPCILAASDLLVFPATVPHFARPIIEAGAMGMPVVASDVGGGNELVVDGVTGLLVPPGDPVRLGQAIVALLTNQPRARAMGEAGYRRAQNLFEAKNNAARTFEIYEEIIGSG